MNQKASLSQKKRWAVVPQEQKSEMMGNVVRVRHAKMSKKEKKKLSERLLKARMAKRKKQLA